MATSNTSRPKVVITRDLGPEVMPLLLSRADQDIDVVVWDQGRPCDRTWLLENVAGSSALVVLRTDKVDAELLNAAGPQLRVVSTMSVGYEHIDVHELAKRNIKLGHTPDVPTEAVADISVMLALMAGGNARETMTIVNNGQVMPEYNWAPFLFCGRQLSASKSSPTRVAGFIGFGRIARATLMRLVPFGITDCLYTSNPLSKSNPSRDSQIATDLHLRSVRRVDLQTLAEQSDVVFVLAPGGEETANIVNEEFLKKMKRSAVLVNASRGSLVDSDALAKALREGWIWGAGLDVVKGEPRIAADHPLVKEPRCVILPHIGSATIETLLEMATLAINNALMAIFDKDMPASLDLSAYSKK